MQSIRKEMVIYFELSFGSFNLNFLSTLIPCLYDINNVSILKILFSPLLVYVAAINYFKQFSVTLMESPTST